MPRSAASARYEYLLAKAQQALRHATDEADLQGHEGDVEDLLDLRIEMARLIEASAAGKPGRSHRPIPGQTSWSERELR